MIEKRLRRYLSRLFSLLLALLCLGLLFFGEAVRQGAKNGLLTCANVIIPSLYLFMAMAGFIAASPAGVILSRPLAPFVRHVLRLPEALGAAVVLSFIGGYPVGARAIVDLLERGKITNAQAQRAVAFCCNAGPSFVVTAVGGALLGSVKCGALLLAAHIIAALLLGVLLARGQKTPPRAGANAPCLSYSQAFIHGVNGATGGILTICAFVVFFSAFGALLAASGTVSLLSSLFSKGLPFVSPEAVNTVICGILEVTSGCIAAARLPGSLPAVLIPLFLSFSGLSIIFQVRACFAAHPFSMGRFIFCRVLHAALTLALSYPFLQLPIFATEAFSAAEPPLVYRTPNTPIITALLLLVLGCVLYRLSATVQAQKTTN